MTYVVFVTDYIHHLMNELKMLIFAYNNDWRVYNTILMSMIGI